MQPRLPTHDFHQTLVDFIAESKRYAKSSLPKTLEALENDVIALMDNEITLYEAVRSLNPHQTAQDQFVKLLAAEEQVKKAEKKLDELTDQQKTNLTLLEEKQRQLTHAILLENSNSNTNTINKMTSSNARFLQLTQQMAEAKTEIDNINKKCFSCCCDYGKQALEARQEAAQRELDALTRAEKATSTDTPQKSARLFGLEQELATVNEIIKKAVAERATPSSQVQDDAKATLHEARLAHETLKMTIDNERYYYNAALGQELMLYCVRVFERFMQLKSEAKGDLSSSANRYYSRLQAFMNLFWCTESDDRVASQVYQAFKALPESDQTDIFNTPIPKTLLDQLLPEKPGDTLELLKAHEMIPPDILIPEVAPLERVTPESIFKIIPNVVSVVNHGLGLTIEHRS